MCCVCVVNFQVSVSAAVTAQLLMGMTNYPIGPQLGIAIPDFFSNPGISGLKKCQSRDPGIESLILN